MKKLFFPFILLLFLAACVPRKKQPNFVVILVDDLGWADLSCNYKESFYETPNIDRLAARGVRFSQAYAASPVSSPSRAALLTGKQPNRLGITDWIPGSRSTTRPLLSPSHNNELALEETTLAEKLKENDYVSSMTGKWHLGGKGFFPEDQGFDVNISGSERGSWPAPPSSQALGQQNNFVDEYGTGHLTDQGIRFIEENRGKPFFLYLSYYAVHTPIHPSEKYLDSYKVKRARIRSGEAPFTQEGDGWTKKVQDNAGYASMVSDLDENVGRIVNALRDQGLDKDTWIIFTSDNGGLSTLLAKNAPTSNGPLRAGKGWCYEGGLRVPLLIVGPDVSSPGRVEEQPVITMDLFTTILSLAGIDHDKFDGENLAPILAEGKQIDREALFWHYPHYHDSAWKPGSALRKGDWKLVVHYEGNRTELYNLKDDPGEAEDIARRYPERTNELKELLERNLVITHARFPVPNSNYRHD